MKESAWRKSVVEESAWWRVHGGECMGEHAPGGGACGREHAEERAWEGEHAGEREQRERARGQEEESVGREWGKSAGWRVRRWREHGERAPEGGGSMRGRERAGRVWEKSTRGRRYPSCMLESLLKRLAMDLGKITLND